MHDLIMSRKQENSSSVSSQDNIPYVQPKCSSINNDQQKSVLDYMLVDNGDIVTKQKRPSDDRENKLEEEKVIDIKRSALASNRGLVDIIVDNNEEKIPSGNKEIRLEEGEVLNAKNTTKSVESSLVHSIVNCKEVLAKQKRPSDNKQRRLEDEEILNVNDSIESSEQRFTDIVADNEDVTNRQKRACDEIENKLEEGEVLVVNSIAMPSERGFGIAIDSEGIATGEKRLCDETVSRLERGELIDIKSTETSLLDSVVKRKENSTKRKFCAIADNNVEVARWLDVGNSSGSVGKGVTIDASGGEENIMKRTKFCTATENRVEVGDLLRVQNSDKKSIFGVTCNNMSLQRTSSGLACAGNGNNGLAGIKDDCVLQTATVDAKASWETNEKKKRTSTEDTHSHYDSNDKREKRSLTGAPILSSETKKRNNQHISKEKDKILSVSLIPEKRDILSDYNLMLTENIELFEVPTVYNIRDGADRICTTGLPTSKVGLRCIHCSSHVGQVTAASFFPSSIGSIASGVGTIGARHFTGGKCPNISNSIMGMLKQNKKASQQQTRTQGRIGLDAYCRALSKRIGINNLNCGGIHFSSLTGKIASVSAQMNNIPTQKISIFSAGSDGNQSHARKRKSNTDANGATAFIEGEVENFWECRHCNSLPYYWRASGSVVFSAETPSLQLVTKHLSICKGKTPLRIPRNASISTKESEKSISVLIRWENQDTTLRKSNRIQRKLLTYGNGKKRRNSFSTATRVNENVDDKVLVLPKDKSLTTDFAYFTVMQLKKCYLTKPGGSRSNCPLGYPGLACSYCEGSSTPRRFFYTSPDHLRNSFSHIPSHLAMCSKCPDHVKQKLEKLKETRSRQKSLLKLGEHKQFIDRLWERLHGPAGGIIDILQDESRGMNGDVSGDDSSVSSLSLDLQSDDHCHRLSSTNDEHTEGCDLIPIERTKSILVFENERKEVADYMFYSILQMTPKLIKNGERKSIDNSDSEIKQSTNNQITNIIPSTLLRKIEQNAENTSKNDFIDTTNGGKHSEQTYTIVCRHCKSFCVENQTFPKTADELRRKFQEIPNHLFLCPKCPNHVKEKLIKFKSLRASQEAFLKRGAQKKFLDLVWSRLERHFTNPLSPVIHEKARHSSSTGVARPLVTDNDRRLVTQFTFFTMEQMEPCFLEKSGNGSRSMFQYGFPGLSCRHCTGTPSVRKFFYRTADILSGNYAHIPNHVLSCKHCPVHIKKALAEKKKIHANEKMRLHRGSQRIFFNNVWDRLHSNHK